MFVQQVFVGGLLNRCSEDELLAYFSSFGDVTDVLIPFDRCPMHSYPSVLWA